MDGIAFDPKHKLPISETGLSVVDRKIPVGTNGEEISIRIYTPDSSDSRETFPVIIDFHGMHYPQYGSPFSG